MSVKLGLLALLSQAPKYGAQLKSEFETRTGGTLPLNIGQVYTTLARLERDGLVHSTGEPDPEGRIAYALTPAGQREVDAWWATPVERSQATRDELVIKLALALATPGVQAPALVQAQRHACMTHLQSLHALQRRLRSQGPTGSNRSSGENQIAHRALLLVIEHMIYSAEAEARWLDHVHTQLAPIPQPAYKVRS